MSNISAKTTDRPTAGVYIETVHISAPGAIRQWFSEIWKVRHEAERRGILNWRPLRKLLKMHSNTEAEGNEKKSPLIIRLESGRGFYGAVCARFKFLALDVNVELLEILSGAAIWVEGYDMLDLVRTHRTNPIYAVLIYHGPLWGYAAGLLAFGVLHFRLVMRGHLKARMIMMVVAMFWQLSLAIAIWGASDRSLVWKFVAGLVVTSFFSHVRLRMSYRDEKKLARQSHDGGDRSKDDRGDNISGAGPWGRRHEDSI